jgi:hypothetical protein
MNIDKEFVLNGLLRHNYLPAQRRAREEFPPIFSTEAFSPAIATQLAELPLRKGGFDQADYKLTRFNTVSRILGMPHPLPYAKLAIAMAENWAHADYIASNPSSHIKPQQFSDGRLMIMNGYADTVEKANRHIGHAFGNLYKVKADIANFYPSIYSHAVPWALVGHEVAKKNQDPKEWFNNIDRCLRACKKNETQGVAIGPGTSSIAAEIILARVDEAMRERGFEYDRYIDDYTAHCASEDGATTFLLALEKEISKYKLLLNIKKTEVTRLPRATGDIWVADLIERAPKEEWVSASEAFRFLDFAVELSKNHQGGSVLKFAAAMLAGKEFPMFDHLHLLNYLFTLGYHQPALLPSLSPFVYQATLKFGKKKVFLGDQPAKLNRIVVENARVGRSDGMSWGLYYLGNLDAPIYPQTAERVIESADCFALLTLYWTGQHVEKVAEFSASLDTTDLYEIDRYWPLLYQQYRDGKFPNPYPDATFDVMKKDGFSLFATTPGAETK